MSLAVALVAGFLLIDRSDTARASRPNILVIQVDDLALPLLRSKIQTVRGTRPAMPVLLRQIERQGVRFNRYYVSNPICAPSRASLLSGQSTHNHGMLINASPYGFEHWQDSPLHASNLATWLQDAGYRTAHVGKFFNGYDSSADVPPGWDRWVTSVKNSGAPYYGSSLNIDGFITKPIGNRKRPDRPSCRVALPSVTKACKHATDIQTAFAVDEIRRASKSGDPFFIQVDFNAPHDDGVAGPGPTPPTRYRSLVQQVKVPPIVDDVRGNDSKPFFIRRLNKLTPRLKREIRERYAREVVAMRAVDDAMGRMLKALKKQEKIVDTYVLFFSDNGFFHGAHRVAYGKYLPYEPSTRQPLLIRGPGIPRGKQSKVLSSNLDIASTIMNIAGAAPPQQTDGISILPFARHPARSSNRAILLEGFDGRDLDHQGPFTDGAGRFGLNQALVLNYTGFVAGRWKYIRYHYGDEELYDLWTDSEERNNLARDTEFAPVIRWARDLSATLQDCSGTACSPQVTPPAAP